MKSIKPGRGPSAMGGVGAIIGAVFGVIWTIYVSSIGAPILFTLFGVVFVIMGIAQAVYNFKNAIGKNRFSAFDITDAEEEKDPIQTYVEESRGSDRTQERSEDSEQGNANFCPYCGTEVHTGFVFCENCGKKLP